MNQESIVVYRSDLLQPAETFVLQQSKSLQKFVPYYAGSRLAHGLPLPPERTLVVNQGGVLGRVNEIGHKVWRPAPNLVRRLRKLKPALIHAHFGIDGAEALPLARVLDVPLVVTFHGHDATVQDEYARRQDRPFRRYLNRRETLKREAQLFIAVSQFIASKLVEQGFPPDKVVVHYTGIDTEAFRPDPVAKREPVVLFVGRLVEAKGCEYLIRAMSKVQATVPDAELVIAGDGPLRPLLQQLAKELLHRYRFLGWQPYDNVRMWMNRAKVFCVPSVVAKSGETEGFGMVFAEAQATGLPVASFATGPIPEVVAHGQTGFLAAERDWRTLADHITLLLEDNALWSRFSAAGQRRVREMFDLKQQTVLLEQHYERAIRAAKTVAPPTVASDAGRALTDKYEKFRSPGCRASNVEGKANGREVSHE